MGKSEEVTIKVNKEELPLNPFVTSLVGNLVWALIDSLKTEEEAREVVIEVFR